ncbi:hypothetical protein A6A11_03305 [Bisgaardia hudsonensis]|nr:hypothetical protein [Bisgaardia hudsonensis]QLB12699.1 hypothetical protein A6A11_03305 [Bisgaardia hudsonensis]
MFYTILVTLALFSCQLNQQTFDYQGYYETFTKTQEEYRQTLSIIQNEQNYNVYFSASKIKGKPACQFSGTAKLKNNILWVNIANNKNNQVLMSLIPTSDKLAVEVFTQKFEERFTMMQYCSGGASLAGKYIKK